MPPPPPSPPPMALPPWPSDWHENPNQSLVVGGSALGGASIAMLNRHAAKALLADAEQSGAVLSKLARLREQAETHEDNWRRSILNLGDINVSRLAALTKCDNDLALDLFTERAMGTNITVFWVLGSGDDRARAIAALNMLALLVEPYQRAVSELQDINFLPPCSKSLRLCSDSVPELLIECVEGGIVDCASYEGLIQQKQAQPGSSGIVQDAEGLALVQKLASMFHQLGPAFASQHLRGRFEQGELFERVQQAAAIQRAMDQRTARVDEAMSALAPIVEAAKKAGLPTAETLEQLLKVGLPEAARRAQEARDPAALEAVAEIAERATVVTAHRLDMPDANLHLEAMLEHKFSPADLDEIVAALSMELGQLGLSPPPRTAAAPAELPAEFGPKSAPAALLARTAAPCAMPPSPPSPPPSGGEQAPALCYIESLPDGLLSQIATLVGREHGRSLTLVSRRWHRLVYSEPALWRTFTVRPLRGGPGSSMDKEVEWLEARVQLLEHVAPHVTAFAWRYYTLIGSLLQPGLALCLAALQPGQLAELQLWGNLQLQAPTVEALHWLSGVTSLVLDMNSSTSVQAVLGALGSRLRSFQLAMDAPPSALLDTIVQLTQLTALGMQARQWPPLDPLTRLCCLKQLILNEPNMASGPTQLPPPASFPAGLERYSFDSLDNKFWIGAYSISTCRLWQGSTCELEIINNSDEPLPPELPLATLSLAVDTGTQSLAGLLPALQPDGAAACFMQHLELWYSLPRAAYLGSCPQLQQLRELALLSPGSLFGHVVGHDSSLDYVVPMLLSQAPRLQSLHISGADGLLRALPEALSRYSGLTSLSLQWLGLRELGPAGMEWQDLRSLNLSGNRLTSLPDAISCATGLTSLCLSDNSQLTLGEADGQALLALHNLQQLDLRSIQAADPALLHDLRARMPCLSILASLPGEQD